MRSFSNAQIQKMNDRRLLSAILYKDEIGYPFDYVELCKEELRRRGYTNSDIQREVDNECGDGDVRLPSRFDLRRQLKLRRTIMLVSAGIAVMLFASVFGSAGNSEFPAVVIGAIALGAMISAFVCYASMALLKAQLASRETEQGEEL